MSRLHPAVFALLGSTLAASAAWASLPTSAPSSAPAASVPAAQPDGRDLSCQALSEQRATLAQAQARKAEQAARGRRMFGFATAALQMAAPLAGNLGGSSAGSLIGAVAQQGAITALQAAAPLGDTAPSGMAPQRDPQEAAFDAKAC